MLALSPLRCCSAKDEKEGEALLESFLMGGNEFQSFCSGSNLLESIDFDDLFVGIDDGDVLPDLEMDSEMFSEFSISSGGEELEAQEKIDDSKKEEDDRVSGSEIGCKREESAGVNSSKKAGNRGRKSSAQSKSSHGKRKVKVDWTPELHKRFVQAVEQLGIDKAVPSKILEIMGIHSANAATATTDGCMDINPASSSSTTTARPFILAFTPQKSNSSSSYPGNTLLSTTTGNTGASQRLDRQHLPILRFPAEAVVPGIPPPHPHSMLYRAVDPGLAGPIGVPARQAGPHPPFLDIQPSTESIDSAIGDVLSKPWQPLPLGLKPPSVDSVVVELQRQGVPKIPPHL
ncbi:hypothetical protein RHSIM_Rhsim06G0137200 [Rhododendron simsii]|uniref:HTH myb-type domain-containing protein n=1 Tax=Rhododendron simsii TaxID=118357 RepID=A0A834GWM4_RHOSS|nr:hypothetical protein RHSIM_Rhsim06G0137200 [Rhododendron simsii]